MEWERFAVRRLAQLLCLSEERRWELAARPSAAGRPLILANLSEPFWSPSAVRWSVSADSWVRQSRSAVQANWGWLVLVVGQLVLASPLLRQGWAVTASGWG